MTRDGGRGVAFVGDGCEDRLPEPLELAVSCPSLAENDPTLYRSDRSSFLRGGPFLFLLLTSLGAEPLTLCESESFSFTGWGFRLLFESLADDGSGDPVIRCSGTREGASGEVATEPAYRLGSSIGRSRASTRAGSYRKGPPSWGGA